MSIFAISSDLTNATLHSRTFKFSFGEATKEICGLRKVEIDHLKA